MRYLRLLPLLILVFSTAATADDHRADYNAALSFCSGSTLTGFHLSHSNQDLTPRIASVFPKFSLVIDGSAHLAGSHEGRDVNRVAIMTGGRWTQPLKTGSLWKVLPTVLTGWVQTTVDGQSTNGYGIAPGIGIEWVQAYSSDKHAWGGRAYVDRVFVVGGDGDSFWRLSFGVVLRKKED